MSLAAVFDTLGQTVLPQVAAAVFPDLMNITGETRSAGTGGGQIKSAVTESYWDVPVTYEPMQIENRLTSADKLLSTQQYMVTFPTHEPSGVRIDIDPKQHKLVVLERGNEPEKTFRIVSIRDQSGVVFEAICTKEN